MAKRNHRNGKEAPKNVKKLTLEVINGYYTLVADGKPTEHKSKHKYYAASKRDLILRANPGCSYEDMTKAGGALAGQSALDQAAIDNPALAFPIDERFEHLRELVKMVGGRQVNACIVTGPGGLGKSHEVLEGLKELGLKDVSDMSVAIGSSNNKSTFRVVKGYTTVKGMYDTLWENKDGLLVFDDCDAAFDDPDAANVLKSALDTYDKRIISWNRSREYDRDKEVPGSFEFKGGIIFISNKSQTKIDQAVRTRAFCVDVSMTVDQILARMATISKAENFMPDVDLECKKDALELINELKDNIKNLSLRSLISATKIRHAKGKNDWKKLATFALLSAA